MTPKIRGGETIKSIRYSLDGKTIGQTTSARPSLAWNSRKVKNGYHQLQVQVTDRVGKTARSIVRIRVSN